MANVRTRVIVVTWQRFSGASWRGRRAGHGETYGSRCGARNARRLTRRTTKKLRRCADGRRDTAQHGSRARRPHRGARGDVRPALGRRRGLAAGRVLQQPVRGDLPPGLDEARGARALRQRAAARTRGRRARHRARAVRRPVRDDRLGAGRRGARSNEDRVLEVLGAEDFKVPPARARAARRRAHRLHADGRRRPLRRRRDVRARSGPAGDGRGRAPSAVDARQGDRDGLGGARGDRLRRAAPPAAAADRPRARDPRGRRAAAVRDLARALARGAARRRQPAPLRRGGAERARRPAHRARRARSDTPRAPTAVTFAEELERGCARCTRT